MEPKPNRHPLLVHTPSSRTSASFPEQSAVFLQFRNQPFGASLRAAETIRQLVDVGACVLLEELERPGLHYVAFVRWLCEGKDRIPNRLKHELDERFAGTDSVGFCESLVVACLALPDRAFDGQPCQYRPPLGEQEGMPEPSGSAVAVRKRMAELELEMEDAGGEEGVHRGGREPLEDVGHDFGNVCSRGPCVDQGVSVEHANVARPEAARLGDEALHHDAVRAQEIFKGARVEFGDEVVGALRVFDLQDVIGIAEDPLAVEDRGDGLLVELVALDEQRRVDRLDPELPVEHGAFRQRRIGREHPHELRDLHAERVNPVVALERR